MWHFRQATDCQTSCVVPVPGHPSTLKDYRTIPFISHIMRSTERLKQSPATQTWRMLWSTYSYLDKARDTIRTMFFISLVPIPSCLSEWERKVVCRRQWWAVLEHHRQLSCLLLFSLSTHRTSSTTLAGVLWWAVLEYHSPVSFRLQSLHIRLPAQHLQEFFDDSSIVGWIHTEDESEVQKAGSGQYKHLQLNISKTKELVVDFQHVREPIKSVNICRGGCGDAKPRGLPN